jgi:dienelactone hydrolase
MDPSMDYTVRRRASLVCSVVAACALSATSLMAMPAAAGPSEVLYGPDGVVGLLYPPDLTPSPAVLVVNDALGMDTRSNRYIDHLTAAGLAVLEVEVGANPLDGRAEPLPGDVETASLVARAAAALAGDPRVDPARIAALGFGIGARAVALVPPRGNGRDTFAARVLVYPGCGSLDDMMQAAGGAAVVASPLLLMHGEDDPANKPAECERLATTLGRTASVRRLSFRGASYAWDVPLRGEGVYSRQPWPGGQGTVLVRSWPELADQTAAQTAAFLNSTLSKGEAP